MLSESLFTAGTQMVLSTLGYKDTTSPITNLVDGGNGEKIWLMISIFLRNSLVSITWYGR